MEFRNNFKSRDSAAPAGYPSKAVLFFIMKQGTKFQGLQEPKLNEQNRATAKLKQSCLVC